MKTKNLFIVRHGQTEYNRLHKVQGSGIDAPLNDTGRQQAKAFYNAYKDHHFDKLYISNLIRTYQSVEGFINDGLSYEKLGGLNEISWGDKEGHAFTESGHQEYKDMVEQWNSGNLDYRIPNGESPIEVMQRQKKAMEVIMSRPEESSVLICMHGRAMRILLAWLLDKDLSKMDSFSHENLCLYQLAHDGSHFSIERFDERSHLSSI